MIDTQGCALACVSAALRGGRLEPIRQLDFVNAPVCEAITADLCATISWKEHQGGAVDAIALPTQGGRGARKEDAVVEHIAEVSAATRAAQLTAEE
eukprot:CAMPEP_0181219836 /NCGR_PEP_ID=MMETSP1096-20121128/28503_1 /TAXON_ID=156174 ORGANISM="Chrysochromulina ericina, Strain CCMP281" /NCGR_SAMPLE_ID=MMETSP1096 /ASSEMBLY_ACC=CAM_ASM_000453 /LENGTH=95 /DNA_ID=CAMNT_0023312273 /DNA_START=735 /DNA_END=1019 /DNA_ORIENTATION=+